MTLANYTLTYDRLLQRSTPEKRINTAVVRVTRGGEDMGTLEPQRNFHVAQQQPQSEIAIRTTPIEDLYVVVTAFDPDGAAAIRAFVNPLTWWIWAGAGIMAMGMTVLFSEGTRAPAAVTARVVAGVREPAVVTR